MLIFLTFWVFLLFLTSELPESGWPQEVMGTQMQTYDLLAWRTKGQTLLQTPMLEIEVRVQEVTDSVSSSPNSVYEFCSVS